MKLICNGYIYCASITCEHSKPHEKNSCDTTCETQCHGYNCTQELLPSTIRKEKLKNLKLYSEQ